MRSLDEFETVKNLAASGINDCAIARKTGYRGEQCKTYAAGQ